MKPVRDYILFFLLTAALASLEAENHGVQVPLPAAVQDLRFGISLREFVKLRPDATTFNLNLRERPQAGVDLSRNDQLVFGTVKGDRFFSVGLYKFRGGGLRQIVLTGEHERDERFRRECTKFWEQWFNQWGTNFVTGVTRLDCGNFECDAPVLLWKTNSVQIAAMCTPDFEGEPLTKGQFQLRLTLTEQDDNGDETLGLIEVDKHTKDRLLRRIGLPKTVLPKQ